MDIIKELEKISKKRSIIICFDKEDGYFLQIESNDSDMVKSNEIADNQFRIHDNLKDACIAAIEYCKAKTIY